MISRKLTLLAVSVHKSNCNYVPGGNKDFFCGAEKHVGKKSMQAGQRRGEKADLRPLLNERKGQRKWD